MKGLETVGFQVLFCGNKDKQLESVQKGFGSDL